MHRRGYLKRVGAVATAGVAGCPAFRSTGPVEWRHSNPQPVRTLAIGSSTTYLAGVVQDRTTTLTGIGLEAGDHQWDRPLDVSGEALSMRRQGEWLVLQNGLTVIVTAAGFADESWRRQGATPPVFAGDTAYLRTVEGGRTWIESVVVSEGATTWRIDLSDRDQVPEPQYPVARAGDRLAVTFQRYPLTVRSVDDGSITWRTDAMTGSLVAGSTDTFYVGAEGRRTAGLTAYDARKGDRTQVLSTQASTVAPAIVGDRLRVRVRGPETARVVVFDAVTGDRLWGVDGYRGRTAWTTTDTVYAIDDRNRFVALAAGDGSRRWDSQLEPGDRLPRVRFTDTSVVVGTPGRVTAYDRDTGATRWEYDLDTSSGLPYHLVAGPNAIVVARGTRVVGLPG